MKVNNREHALNEHPGGMKKVYGGKTGINATQNYLESDPVLLSFSIGKCTYTHTQTPIFTCIHHRISIRNIIKPLKLFNFAFQLEALSYLPALLVDLLQYWLNLIMENLIPHFKAEFVIISKVSLPFNFISIRKSQVSA